MLTAAPHVPFPSLTCVVRTLPSRIAACFLFIFVTWDLKTVFYAIWTPFTFLMGYNDPRKPTNDALHGACRASVGKALCAGRRVWHESGAILWSYCC